MDAYVWWAVAGIGLIIVEMMSGTLILLILGLAAFVGAAAAWLGYSFATQAVTAAALGAVGMIAASQWKKSHATPASNNSLDIGHTVILESWVSEVDGIAKVRYRNATWDAKVSGTRTPGGTVFYINATDGNTLLVSSSKNV